ncbi:MAG: YsnF/AvaK domain-containing protein [Bacillota bacterium]
MSRTVAALYDTRSEAELARARLISEFRARSPRIIAKDTIGAVDGLKIAKADADSYRDGLRRGAHLLVAEVPGTAPAKRVIELLRQSMGAADTSAEQQWGDGEQGVRVELPDDSQVEEPPAATAEQSAAPEVEEAADAPAPEAVEEARIPVVEEEVRIGKRQVVGGGARVRSFTREAPAEEQVVLHDESVDVERRPCERQLTDTDVEAGGLFTERVFEIAEMREEPVVTKTAVVREEVIVRKKVHERTETIRDTLRHTEVEVEDLPAASSDAPRFFGRN